MLALCVLELGFLSFVLTLEACARPVGAGDVWIFPLLPRPEEFYRGCREGQSVTENARQLRIDHAKVKKGHADLQRQEMFSVI
jgi:hypothetical protein